MNRLLDNYRDIVQQVYHTPAVPIQTYEHHLGELSSCVSNASEWFEYRSFSEIFNMSDKQRVLLVGNTIPSRVLSLTCGASLTSHASGKCHGPHTPSACAGNRCLSPTIVKRG